jgi:hypothetical protein
MGQKETTFRMVKYRPNPSQARIHNSQAQILQVVGAEGGGKSHVTGAEITACVPWCKLVYLVGQTYTNAEMEFNYLVDNLLKLGALDPARVSQPKQGSWSLTTRTGCRVITLSVERGAAAIIAKGEQPDIIALCEAGVINSYSVFLASVRRARRARGRVILVGTLKDDFGWYASLVDELQAAGNPWKGETYNLPAWTNTALYPGGRNDPEIKYLEATMPADEFSRTVAAEKVPSRALVFPEFSYTQHVRPCPFDRDLPVHIWIDPGYFPSVYAVLPVQFHGDGGWQEVWQIDEVYLNHHFHEQVIDEAKRREWWGNVERAVIDFAGRQHHAEKSAEDVWASLARIRPHSQQVGILDGIARHRTFLNPQRPRLFHDPRCKGTLGEYKQYKRPTDRDGNPTNDMPKDEHNHAMKALAYGLVDRFGFVDNKISESVVIARRDIIEEIDESGW